MQDGEGKGNNGGYLFRRDGGDGFDDEEEKRKKKKLDKRFLTDVVYRTVRYVRTCNFVVGCR